MSNVPSGSRFTDYLSSLGRTPEPSTPPSSEPAWDYDPRPAEPPTFDWEAATKARTSTAQPIWRKNKAPPKYPPINGSIEKSPIELRIFALPDDSPDAALRHVRSMLDKIPDLAIDNLLLINGPWPSTVIVRWSEDMWLSPALNLAIQLDIVRRKLAELGLAVFWSCAREMDRRNTATFIFDLPSSGSATKDPLTEKEAVERVVDYCAKQGHPTVNAYALSFPEARAYKRPLVVVVNFYHVPSVEMMATVAHSFRCNQYEVSYDVARNVILPDFPTTIVLPNASPNGPSMDKLLHELDGWIAEFNHRYRADAALLEFDGRAIRMVHNRHFIVSPSSVALARYICQQMSKSGRKYELAYELNDRSLVPLGSLGKLPLADEDLASIATLPRTPQWQLELNEHRKAEAARQKEENKGIHSLKTRKETARQKRDEFSQLELDISLALAEDDCDAHRRTLCALRERVRGWKRQAEVEFDDLDE